MSTQLAELLRHVAGSAASQNMTVREVLDSCETTATPVDLLLLLDAERRRQGLKKYELANLCGVSGSMFSKLTSAKASEHVKVATLLMIAVALGILDPQEVKARPMVSTKSAKRTKAKRTKARRTEAKGRAADDGPKRRANKAPQSAPQVDEPAPAVDQQDRSSWSGIDPQANRAAPEDYATVDLREAAVMLHLPLSTLVQLAEEGRLLGALRQGGRWRMDPTTLAQLIQARGTGEETVEAIAELRRRLDVVEQANEELKGQVKLIESMRELLLQHRHNGGGSAQQSETKVLDHLPAVWPNHFKPGEPVLLGDLLRAFPDASAHSIEFLATTLMFPAPPREFLTRFVEEWTKLYQSVAKAKRRSYPGEKLPDD